MLHQLVPQLCGKTGCRLCREILREQRAAQTDCREQRHEQAHSDDIALVVRTDALVNHGFDDQRHQQLKCRLQHFEQRPQDTFLFVIPEQPQQFFHSILRQLHGKDRTVAVIPFSILL